MGDGIRFVTAGITKNGNHSATGCLVRLESRKPLWLNGFHGFLVETYIKHTRTYEILTSSYILLYAHRFSCILLCLFHSSYEMIRPTEAVLRQLMSTFKVDGLTRALTCQLQILYVLGFSHSFLCFRSSS